MSSPSTSNIILKNLLSLFPFSLQDKLAGGRQPRRPFLLRRNIRNKDNQLGGGSASPASTIGPNGMMALESPAAETIKVETKTSSITGGVTKEDGIGGAAAAVSATRSDYQIVDTTEVKLNMNSYKMVWVTNKHGLFYKRNSMAKARKVSVGALQLLVYWVRLLSVPVLCSSPTPQNHPAITKRLKACFSQFTDKWAAKNVNRVQETQCVDWMLGKVVLENSQVVPGGVGAAAATTTVCKDNDIARTPYFLYNRYKVFKGDR